MNNNHSPSLFILWLIQGVRFYFSSNCNITPSSNKICFEEILDIHSEMELIIRMTVHLYIVLATVPNQRFGHRSRLEPNWNHCNGFHPINIMNHTKPAVFWLVPQFPKLQCLALIKYLSSDCITIWYICKRCSFAWSFTCCSPICDPINIPWVAVK